MLILLICFSLRSGEFADVLGEDYLGLRALGIAAEFGLSNLSIPKKLLKGKKGQNKPMAALPSEPPLPYPPPPPFVPFRAGDIDDQIGLLKPYYHNRIALLVVSSAPPPIAVPPAPLPGPMLGHSSVNNPSPTLPPGNQSASHSSNMSNPPAPASASAPSPDLILPDDVPNPSQLKMNPIGQILKSGGASGGTKKKGKVVAEGSGAGNVAAAGAAATAATAVGPSSPAVPAAVGMSGTRLGESGAPKKKKGGATGVGTGNGRKKTVPVPPSFPPPMVVR